MKHEPGMAYDTKTLNKVFAVLSILFLISVVWIMLDDYIRPWKGFQLKSLEIKREVISKQVKAINDKMDAKKIEELKKKVEAGQKTVENNKGIMKSLETELAKVRGKIHAEKMHNGGLNAAIAETSFIFETAEDKGDSKADKIKIKLDRLKVQFAESKEALKKLQEEEKEKKKQLEDASKVLTTAEKELDDAIGVRDRLIVSLDKTKLNPITLARNLPFIDYLDPTLKVEQVVLENITDDRYFQQVPKVDRCMTCHTFIDQAGYEDQKNPFKTHPKLDLMVGLNSPHPMKGFGCTTCHGGEGHRVHDFQAIAHTPQNDAQAAEWKEKYHWHEPHKVPQPMLRLQDTEASCVKCHQGVERIPGATVLNQGREEIRENGCYACHKIQGWEHFPKPGPSLEKVAAKLDKNFVKNWIWDPTSFNKHAKMPSFFNQSNNSDPDFKKKNITEVNAIAEFLWEKSKEHIPHVAVAEEGNPEKGKELISEIGCLGCHQVAGLDDTFQKSRNRRGPYLAGLGSKVNKDWLVSWILKPQHYSPKSIMPSFRLSESEANDIATYLLGLKNDKFKEKIFDKIDNGTRDELLLSYLTAFDTEEAARIKLGQMDDRQKTLDLGERSVGKYGCYSCHDIQGFEGRAPIGPELSKLGSKPVEQFGFGHEHIPHKREAWITHHLKNPRRWDHGVPKTFQDLLRMPKFHFTDKQVKNIVVALLGQVGEKVPLDGMKKLSPAEALAEEGYKVLSQKNCMGCHRIDEVGGEILKNYEDNNEGPPHLFKEGHRVQSPWLHGFLDNVSPIRPWLKVRMPSFALTNEERNAIVSYFQFKAHQPFFEDDVSKLTWEPGEKEAASQLFKKLECTTCHTTGFTKDNPTAPDLHGVKKRLRPSWVEAWLSNPQKFLPYTPMPAFWENGQTQEPTILEGNADKQIKALTKYIIEMGG